MKHIFFLLGQGKADIDDIVWTGVPQPSGGFSGNTWLWLGFSEMALLVQKKVVPLLLFLGSIRRSQMNKVCHDALHLRRKREHGGGGGGCHCTPCPVLASASGPCGASRGRRLTAARILGCKYLLFSWTLSIIFISWRFSHTFLSHEPVEGMVRITTGVILWERSLILGQGCMVALERIISLSRCCQVL